MKATPFSCFLTPHVPGQQRDRPAKLTPLSQMRLREPEWLFPVRDALFRAGDAPGSANTALWPAHVAIGKVTILVGEAGLGKGAIAVDLAARLSHGASGPDGLESPAPQAQDSPASLGTTLVVCSAEEQLVSMREQLVAAGADLDRISAIETAPAIPTVPVEHVPPSKDGLGNNAAGEGHPEIPLELPLVIPPASMMQQLAALRAALQATPDCKLVVIDPLCSFLGGPDGRRSRAMQLLLRALAQLAAKFRVAIVAIEQLNGRATQQSIDRLLMTFGPSPLRSVWGVFRDPDDAEQQLMLPLEGNFARKQPTMSFRLLTANAAEADESGATGKRSLPVGGEFDSSMENARADQHGQTAFTSNATLASATRVEWGLAEATSLREVLANSAGFRISEQDYRDKESHVTTRLREVLASGPRDRLSIEREIKASEDRLYRAAKRLGAVSDKGKFLGGWTWMLPEHFPAWQAERERVQEAEKQERRRRKNEKRRRERGELRSEQNAAEGARPEEAELNEASIEEEVARLMTPFPLPEQREERAEPSRPVVDAASRAASELPSDVALPVPLGSREPPQAEDDEAAWEQVRAYEAAILRDKQQGLARAMQEENDPDEGLWWVEDDDLDGGADGVRDGPG